MNLDYTDTYDPDLDFDARYTLATGRRILRHLQPGQTVLELGCATGLMTTLLTGAGRRITAVDRSAPYLQRAVARDLPGVHYLQADIEDLPGLGRFDHIVLANVLHEVDDPQALLTYAHDELCAPSGLVHVSLQNPQSLHRLVAAEMGLIQDLKTVAERGERFGTNRLYEADEIVELASAAGMREWHRDGVFLKPLPNAAMAELPADVLDGFERAARHLPAHGAMNLLIFCDAG
jgi:2-polyprenyl-3-methyl-5-hydroxy-6-metoxy-1,4-benzoquinol methylase